MLDNILVFCKGTFTASSIKFATMSFLQLLSPRGGKKLVDVRAWPVKPENMVVDQEVTHTIIRDIHALKLGYSSNEMKVGDPIFIKPSDALQLLNLLKREFHQ